jgi:predicted transcriptional regulator
MRAPLRRPPRPSPSATVPSLPLLGELETTVLEYMWDQGEVDVKDVHRDIGARRGITVSTIQSTLERLHRKGLARRERVSHAYRYEPALSREEFRARAVAVAAGDLKGAAARGVLAAFVDLAAKVDHGNLDHLEALVKKARAQRGAR